MYVKTNIVMEKIDEMLTKPYWVIDILPEQVPAESGGQYFKIAQYLLNNPQKNEIYQTFARVIIKLNCYYLITVGNPDKGWKRNPHPQSLARQLSECAAGLYPLFVMVPESDAMLYLSGDEHYITCYNLNPELQRLLGILAQSEGLFLWQPEQVPAPALEEESVEEEGV